MNLSYSHSKILEAIYNHNLNSPNKTAFFDVEGNAISYSTLWNEILKASFYLHQKGIKKEDKIMISAQKEIEFVYFYFASHLIGAINVVIDSNNTTEHLEYITSVVKPSLCIGFKNSDYPSLLYPDIFTTDEAINLDLPEIKPTDIADIMFTSGTTGNPKGVLLSYFNISSSADNINHFIGNGFDDIEFLGLPLCHSFGLGRLRCNMLTGGTIVLHNGFANIKSVFDTFEKYHVTGFGMVPAIWAYIKKFSGRRISKFSNQIKYIEIGSAAMPLEDKILLSELFPDTKICMHYGLTEASRSLFIEFHKDRDYLDSVGSPVIPSISVEILNESGQSLSDGEEGEICISGNMVTNSYFSSNDNTNAFWNKYFRTGDWGFKKNGRIYLIARKKELINIGGKKVSPIEIENALEDLGVGECMCISIKDPDGILGEVPKVLLTKGSFKKSLLEIQNELRNKIEPYKYPKVFEIVENIPKTESGKKKRT